MGKFPIITNEDLQKEPHWVMTPEQEALPYAKYQKKAYRGNFAGESGCD